MNNNGFRMAKKGKRPAREQLYDSVLLAPSGAYLTWLEMLCDEGAKEQDNANTPT